MKKKKIIIIISVVLVIAALGVGGYFAYQQFFKEEDKTTKPQEEQKSAEWFDNYLSVFMPCNSADIFRTNIDNFTDEAISLYLLFYYMNDAKKQDFENTYYIDENGNKTNEYNGSIGYDVAKKDIDTVVDAYFGVSYNLVLGEYIRQIDSDTYQFYWLATDWMAPDAINKAVVYLDKEIQVTYTIIDNLMENDARDEIGELTFYLDKSYHVKKISYQSIDTTSPELTLKEVSINTGEEYSIKDFIESCTDDSNNDCIYNYKEEEMAEFSKAGTYDIEIIAEDYSGNETSATTKLTIKEVKNSTNTNNSNTTNKTMTNNKTTTNANTNKTTQNNTTTTDTSKDTTSKEVTKVSSTSESSEEVITKYGVKIITTTTIYYDVYSDGSKIETGSTSSTKYDKSGYNATTSELKSEAQSAMASNMSKYNEVVKYTNEIRSEVGTSTLTLDTDLTLAATIRAMEMAYSDVFKADHSRPDGSECFTVLSDLSIVYMTAGENIAMGYPNSASVVEGWKNSPGHYDNMIKDSFNKIGVGYFKLDSYAYWVQIFTN